MALHATLTFKPGVDALAEAFKYRKWATQMARQAGEEPDAEQAQHLLSIAEHWVRLADEAESAQAAPKLECPG